MPSHQNSNDKPSLRRHFRHLRKELDTSQRAARDLQILDHIRRSPLAQESRVIAAYWAMDGEPALQGLLEELATKGVKVALPVTGPGKKLSFREWTPGVMLKANRYGISEPAQGALIPVTCFDLVLMPLVAWDRSGKRLGMGGGYYDRAFAALAESTQPRRVGVAYAMQEAPALPASRWDIELHAVVTEQGWFTCLA